MPAFFRQRLPRAMFAALLLCAGVPALAADSTPVNDQQAQFQNYSSCPATGKRGGACPGYRIGYKVGLCAGGQDRWTNMVWLTDAAYREQQRRDAAVCTRSGNRP